MADCTCSDRYYQAQVHAEGCPSLLSKAPDNPTNAIQPDLIERQFERLIKIEDVLNNGAERADDPECHPLYPQAVAARQILREHITTLQAQRDALREALEAMPDYIEVFRLMRATGKNGRVPQASAVADCIEEIRSKALSHREGE